MKKILLFIVLMLFIIPVYAREIGYNSDGYERNANNNYGVNKKIDINSNNKTNIMNTPYVDPSLKVYDYANVFSEEEKKEIKSLIDGFISDTKLDFVFVSIDMEYTNDEVNDDYANDFYDYNDFGINNEYYGGVVFLVNMYEKNKIYIASVIGEAQYYCNESRLDELLDDIFVYFRDSNYENGLTTFIHSFKKYYDKGYDSEKYYLDDKGVLKKKYSLPYFMSVLSGAFVSLLSVLGLAKKNKVVRVASDANDYLVKTSFNYLNMNDNLISSITNHHIITSTTSSTGHSHSGIGSSGRGHISGGRHF